MVIQTGWRARRIETGNGSIQRHRGKNTDPALRRVGASLIAVHWTTPAAKALPADGLSPPSGKCRALVPPGIDCGCHCVGVSQSSRRSSHETQ